MYMIEGCGGWEKSVSLAADCVRGAEEAEAKGEMARLSRRIFMAKRDVVAWAEEPRPGPNKTHYLLILSLTHSPACIM